MNLEIHYADEWAALYVDGKLECVGDSYIAEEKALALCGVEVKYDPSFLQGGYQRADVAQTLEEVDAYRKDREEKAAKADLLRQKAQRLLIEADELEND